MGSVGQQPTGAAAGGRWYLTDRELGYWMVAPALLIILAVAFYPIARVFYTSFFREYLIFGIHKFAGLDNYQHLLADGRFWNSLWNTVYFAAVSVTLEMLLGLAIALTLNQATAGWGLLRTAILIPWALPTVVSARMWELIFNSNYGVLNYLLLLAARPFEWLGWPILTESINWTGNKYFAIHAAILADVWKTTPFVALLLLAGLQIIPRDLYSAARMDGATAWTRFREITLPMLMPTILVTLLFRTLDAFRVFDLIYVLTGGGPANTTETLSIYAYKVLFEMSMTGYGSTLAVVVFLCVLAISMAYIRLLGREGAR